jgi:hypothetical protein
LLKSTVKTCEVLNPDARQLTSASEFSQIAVGRNPVTAPTGATRTEADESTVELSRPMSEPKSAETFFDTSTVTTPA